MKRFLPLLCTMVITCMTSCNKADKVFADPGNNKVEITRIDPTD